MTVDLIKRLEEAKDRFMNGDLGRREFLKILGMAGVSAGLVSLPVGRFHLQPGLPKNRSGLTAGAGLSQKPFPSMHSSPSPKRRGSKSSKVNLETRTPT